MKFNSSARGVVVIGRELWFPNPEIARATPCNRPVAIGGDLSPERLLLAYRMGIYPWSNNPVTWWSPDPRAIFDFDKFHIPRSLKRTLRRNVFVVTVNKAFRQVMLGCVRPQGWITPDFLVAYGRLHDLGFAHSIECWHNGELAGGLYGVAIGGFFSAESMFHRKSDASKVAVCHLIQRLKERGFVLCDIQMLSAVTRQLGGIEIPRSEYLQRLKAAVNLPCSFV